MPDIFVFRQIDYRDIPTFFADSAIRSKNFTPTQACHQTSYTNLVNRRGTNVFHLPTGGVVNDYVAFYFSPITSFTYTIHLGNVQVLSPLGNPLDQSKKDDRVFIVCDPIALFDAGLQCCFSDYALNSNAPQPTVVSDRKLLTQHVHWEVFNDEPMIAAIPEVGYQGVCQFFADKATPKKYQSRKSMRMAEFLVHDSVPLEYVTCIVTPTAEKTRIIENWMRDTKWKFPILTKPECFLP